MIALESRAEGILLPVRAQPGARSAGIRGEQDGSLKVCVTQVAEKGKANKAILEVLAKQLRLRKSQLALVSGETSHQKRILVRDIKLADLQQRIAEVLK